jgi:hypothetical protein
VAIDDGVGVTTVSSTETVLAMKMVNINKNRKPEQPVKDGRSFLRG